MDDATVAGLHDRLPDVWKRRETARARGERIALVMVSGGRLAEFPGIDVEPFAAGWPVGSSVRVEEPRQVGRGPGMVAVGEVRPAGGDIRVGTGSDAYTVGRAGWIELPSGDVLSAEGWVGHGHDFVHRPTGAFLRGDTGWIGLAADKDGLERRLDAMGPGSTQPYTLLSGESGLYLVPGGSLADAGPDTVVAYIPHSQAASGTTPADTPSSGQRSQRVAMLGGTPADDSGHSSSGELLDDLIASVRVPDIGQVVADRTVGVDIFGVPGMDRAGPPYQMLRASEFPAADPRATREAVKAVITAAPAGPPNDTITLPGTGLFTNGPSAGSAHSDGGQVPQPPAHAPTDAGTTAEETVPDWAVQAMPAHYPTRAWEDAALRFEEGLGALLVRDPRLATVVEQAQAALPGAAAVSSAGPGGPTPSLVHLMTAFDTAVAAHDRPGTFTFAADRNELKGYGEKGLLGRPGPLRSVSGLLRAYQSLNIPGGSVPAFAEAVIGWGLATGQYRLAEMLKDFHDAGFSPDGTGFDTVLAGGGARLYDWARTTLVEGRLAAAPENLREALELPQWQVYFPGLTAEATGGVEVPEDIVDAARATRSGTGPGSADRERYAAMRDWSDRHGSSPLDVLAPPHFIPLYLLAASPADMRLLNPAFRSAPSDAEGRALLTAEIRAVVTEALDSAGPDFPRLLRTEPRLQVIADDLARTKPADPRFDRFKDELLELAERLAEPLYEQLPDHLMMLDDGLARLPRVQGPVFLAYPSVPDRLTIPKYARGSMDGPTALAGLAAPNSGSEPRLLVEVVNPSALDLSFLGPESDARPAAFARNTSFTVRSSEMTDDGLGPVLHWRVEEAGPSGTITTGTTGTVAADTGLSTAPPSGASDIRPTLPGVYTKDRARWLDTALRFERAVGRAMSTNVATPQSALKALVDALAARHTDHLRYFFAPQDPQTFDYATAMDRLLSKNEKGGSNRPSQAEVMEAFALAAPVFAADAPQWVEPADRDPALESRLAELGHPVTGEGAAEKAERVRLAETLMRVHARLNIPRADPLDFRDAVFGWMLSQEGAPPLVQLLGGVQRAGAVDTDGSRWMEPDVRTASSVEVDAAQLYGLVPLLFDPVSEVRRGPLAGDAALKETLRRLPQDVMFAELATDLLAPETLGGPTPDQLRWAVTDSVHSASVASNARRDAFRAWMRKHRRQYRRIAPGGAAALYLLGEAPEFLDERITARSATGRQLLQERILSRLMQLAAGAPLSSLPHVLQREPEVRRLVDHPAEQTPTALRQLARSLATDDLMVELAQLAEMATGTMELLPEAEGPLYWPEIEPGPLHGAHAYAAPGRTFTKPRLFQTTSSLTAATRDLAVKVRRAAGHPVLYRLARPLEAREHGPFTATPDGQAVHPRRPTFTTRDEEIVRDLATGLEYRLVTVEEAERPAGDRKWKEPIITREVRDRRGTEFGEASFSRYDWSERWVVLRDLLHLGDDSLVYEDELSGRPRELLPIPHTPGLRPDGKPALTVWSSHGGTGMLEVLTPQGVRWISGAPVARRGNQLIERLGLGRGITQLVFSCYGARGAEGVVPTAQQVVDGHVHEVKTVAFNGVGGMLTPEAPNRKTRVFLIKDSKDRRAGEKARWETFDRQSEKAAGARHQAAQLPFASRSGLWSDQFQKPAWESAAVLHERAVADALASQRGVRKFAKEFADALVASGKYRIRIPGGRPSVAALMAAITDAVQRVHPVQRFRVVADDGKRVAFVARRGLPVRAGGHPGMKPLFQAYDAVDFPDGHLPLLKAEIASRLSTGDGTLMEILADYLHNGLAADGRGVDVDRLRDAVLGDAPDVYDWAFSVLRPFSGDARDLTAEYGQAWLPPHHQMYFPGLTSRITGDITVPDGVNAALDLMAGASDVPAVPQGASRHVGAGSWQARYAALREWAQHHSGSPLDRLLPTHTTALFLAGHEPDRRLLDPRFLTAPAVGADLLAAEITDTLDAALQGDLDFPYLLQADAHFQELAARARATDPQDERFGQIGEELLALGERLTGTVRANLRSHLAMLDETLTKLPAVGPTEPVYIGYLASGAPGAAPQGALHKMSLPAFQPGSTDPSVVLAELEKYNPGPHHHRVLVKVDGSSARRTAFGAADPRLGQVLFPDRTDLDIKVRGVLYDAEGRPYEYQKATDTAPYAGEETDSDSDSASVTESSDTDSASDVDMASDSDDSAMETDSEEANDSDVSMEDAHSVSPGQAVGPPAANSAQASEDSVPAGADADLADSLDEEVIARIADLADMLRERPTGGSALMARGPGDTAMMPAASPALSPAQAGQGGGQAVAGQGTATGAGQAAAAFPAVHAPRFPVFFTGPSRDSWLTQSEKYGDAVARVLGADPGVLVSAHFVVQEIILDAERRFATDPVRYHGFVRRLLDRTSLVGVDADAEVGAWLQPQQARSLNESMEALERLVPSYVRDHQLQTAWPQSRGPAWDAAMRQRGYRRFVELTFQQIERAKFVERMLGVARHLNIADVWALMFRDAVAGWLVQRDGAMLPWEWFLDASHRAGVRDAGMEPDPWQTDLSRIHGWLNGVLDPLTRFPTSTLADDTHLWDTLWRVPHVDLYETTMLPLVGKDITGQGDWANPLSVLGRELSQQPWVGAAGEEVWEQRREAWQDLMRNPGAQAAMTRMRPAHAIALLLASGADAVFFEPGLTLDQFREHARRAGEFADPADRSTWPTLMLRDKGISDALRTHGSAADVRPAVDAYADAADQALLDEVRTHAAMAEEALDVLFPEEADSGPMYYWTMRPGPVSQGAKPDAVKGETWTFPAFERGSSDRAAALKELNRLAERMPDGWHPVLAEVRKHLSLRKTAIFSRTPSERTVQSPARLSLVVDRAGYGRDESTGLWFSHVVTDEKPQPHASVPWDEEVLARDIRTQQGEWVGFASLTPRDFRTFEPYFELLHQVKGYKIADLKGHFNAPKPWPIPAAKGGPGSPPAFVLEAAHGTKHAVQVVGRFGTKLVSGSGFGSESARRLTAAGIPDDTPLLLWNCSVGGERPGLAKIAQLMADQQPERRDSYAGNVVVGHANADYAGLHPGWGAEREPQVVKYRPRGATVTAPGNIVDPYFAGQSGHYHPGEDQRWFEIADDYEVALGERLLQDGAARAAVQRVVAALAAPDFAVPFDPTSPKVSLEDLMAVVRQARADRYPAAAENILLIKDPLELSEVRRQRGINFNSDWALSTRTYYELYRSLELPSSDFPAWVKAVFGWSLVKGLPLVSLLADLKASGMSRNEAALSAALAGGGAHVYGLADTVFAPREGLPAGDLAGRLRPPHWRYYAEQAPIWSAPGARGIHQVPDGMARAVRLLASSEQVPEILAEFRPVVSGAEWAARHAAVRAWGGAGQGLPLDRLDTAHLDALYVFSQDANRPLLESGLEDLSSIKREARLVLLVDEMIDEAMKPGGTPALPPLLGQHQELADLLKEAAGKQPASTRFAKIRQEMYALVEKVATLLRDQVPLHVGMTVEALNLLPPVDEPVYYAIPVPDKEAVAGLTGLTVRRLAEVWPDAQAALSALGEVPPGWHRVVVRVANSSARDFTPLAHDPSRRQLRYAASTGLIPGPVRTATDTNGDPYEVLETIEAPVAPPEEALGAIAETAHPAEAKPNFGMGNAGLSASSAMGASTPSRTPETGGATATVTHAGPATDGNGVPYQLLETAEVLSADQQTGLDAVKSVAIAEEAPLLPTGSETQSGSLFGPPATQDAADVADLEPGRAADLEQAPAAEAAPQETAVSGDGLTRTVPHDEEAAGTVTPIDASLVAKIASVVDDAIRDGSAGGGITDLSEWHLQAPPAGTTAAPATTPAGQGGQAVAGSASAPGTVHAPPKAPAAHPPRFWSFFLRPSWLVLSDKYGNAVARVLGADPYLHRQAHAAVRGMIIDARRRLINTPRFTTFIQLLLDNPTLAGVDGDKETEAWMNATTPRPLAKSMRALERLAPQYAADHQLPIPTGPQSRGPAWDAAMRQRGYRGFGDLTAQQIARLRSVELLLHVFQNLRIPHGDALMFRDAVAGWLVQRDGAMLPWEWFLDASHRAGLWDQQMEPDPWLTDLSRIHGWINGVLDPLERLSEGTEAQDTKLAPELLNMPHLQMYTEATRPLLDKDITGQGMWADPSGVLGEKLGQQPWSGSEAEDLWQQRREAWQDLMRNPAVPLALERMQPAHSMALTLAGGPDARLFASRNVDELRERIRRVGELADPADRTTWPLVMRRDVAIRDVLDRAAPPDEVKAAVEAFASAADLGLLAEVRVHASMAEEALDLLPAEEADSGPMYYWTLLPGPLFGGVKPDAVKGQMMVKPPFEQGASDLAAAEEQLHHFAQRMPDGWHPVLVEVRKHLSLRKTAIFSLAPWKRSVQSPAPLPLQVDRPVGYRRAERTGQWYAHVITTEKPLRHSPVPWNNEVLFRQIWSKQGVLIGFESHSLRDNRERRKEWAAFPDVNGFKVYDSENQQYGPLQAWPLASAARTGGPARFVVEWAHGTRHAVQAVGRFGKKYVSGSGFGSESARRLTAAGIPDDTPLLQWECSVGAPRPGAVPVAQLSVDQHPPQRVAFAGNMVVGTGPHDFVALAPGWGAEPEAKLVKFRPRGAALPAPKNVTDPYFAGRSGHYRLGNRLLRFGMAKEYERALSERLLQDGAVRVVMERVVTVLAAAQRGRFLDPDFDLPFDDPSSPDVSLKDLLAVVQRAEAWSYKHEWSSLAEDETGMAEIRSKRGIHTSNDPVRSTRWFYLMYRSLKLPSDQFPTYVKGVVGWGLSQDYPLVNLLADFRASRMSRNEAALSAALAGGGVHLYGLADTMFAPREGLPAGDLAGRLRPPHWRYYAEDPTGWSAGLPTGILKVRDGLAKAVRLLAAAEQLPPIPPEWRSVVSAAEWAARHAATRAWGGAGQALPLDRLDEAHIHALYLFSDDSHRPMLDSGLEDLRPGKRTEYLQQLVGETIDRVMEPGGPPALPPLLMQDDGLAELLDDATVVDHRSSEYSEIRQEMHDRAPGVVKILSDQIPIHAGMTAEGLTLLPPVNRPGYYAIPVPVPDQAAAADLTGLTARRFQAVWPDHEAALAALGQVPPGWHRVVVRVANSSARDFTPLSHDPSRPQVRYAAPTDLVPVSARPAADGKGDPYEVLETTEAPTAPPEDALDAIRAVASAAEAPLSFEG
ncbi:hypothetical protein [Streptomyces mirabilis]|uniref:hypothetical protein n=1 Tax=Streptomyces mirabilis TaxID=68239 RepID=UPI0022571336|nr:hypothetical protein [Streptomyces mirabilis]MCX4429007.1 hypothetical protein [Streptomyces mirabilis]